MDVELSDDVGAGDVSNDDVARGDVGEDVLLSKKNHGSVYNKMPALC